MRMGKVECLIAQLLKGCPNGNSDFCRDPEKQEICAFMASEPVNKKFMHRAAHGPGVDPGHVPTSKWKDFFRQVPPDRPQGS